MARWLVVGAGIAGLAAAWEIRRRGEEVMLIEAAHRPGGMLQTFREGGFTLDAAAESVRATPQVRSILGELGLEGAMVAPSAAAGKRFLVRGGRLEVIDPKAVGALTGGDDGPRAGESVAEFFGRKTGPTGTALAEALVTGVYAGDPERLSALHTLGTMLPGSPSVPNLPPSPPVALKGGMITLVERLATGADLRTGERAEMIEPGGRFLVRTSASTFEADRVIVALGPRGLLLLDPTAPRCAEAPVSVMGIGLGLEDLEGTEETNGYGFLCPPSEGRHTLGILFTSAVYPHVAPEGKALWRVFLGGARTPARAGDDKAQALAGALEDIRTLLGLELAPKWVSLLRHPSGIPQPELGHETIIERRAALERTHPGLAFCGLGFEGVAVDQALGSGIAAVRRATER